MRHQKTRHKLSRSASHRKALLANLCIEVIDHERIKTTEAKAKAVKPEIEKLITLARKGDLHARRQATSILQHPDKGVIYKLFEEIAPRYAERPGGYTRILKLGPRSSDATEMVYLGTGLTARLVLEYDGGPFAGWAVQPGQRTVEGELTRALRTVLRAEVSLVVAGRTDAGVHALGQVVSYEGSVPRLRSVNALLPDAVSVLSAEVVADGFSARHDAVSRSYLYRVLARPSPSPFEVGRALWWPHRMDMEALEACAAALRGTHDFTAFTPTRHLPRPVRSRSPGGLLAARGRHPRVPDRGRRLHAPDEPRAGRDDARGRRRPPLGGVVRAPAARPPARGRRRHGAAARAVPRRRAVLTVCLEPGRKQE